MNPVIVSVVAFALVSTMMTTWFNLPMINMHLITMREAQLKESVTVLMDNNFSAGNDLSAQINALDIGGINISNVQRDIQGEYHIYRVVFNHNGLFANKFLTESQILNSNKEISIVRSMPM